MVKIGPNLHMEVTDPRSAPLFISPSSDGRLTSEVFDVYARYHRSKVYGGTRTGGHWLNQDIFFRSHGGELGEEQVPVDFVDEDGC
jgi:hypothetical protein